MGKGEQQELLELSDDISELQHNHDNHRIALEGVARTFTIHNRRIKELEERVQKHEQQIELWLEREKLMQAPCSICGKKYEEGEVRALLGGTIACAECAGVAPPAPTKEGDGGGS